MVDFPIEPELHVRVGPERALRSIDEAVDFARGMAKKRNNREWDGVLFRLEGARGRTRAMRPMPSARCSRRRISWSSRPMSPRYRRRSGVG